MDADNKLYELMNVNRNATDAEIKKVSMSQTILRTKKNLIGTCAKTGIKKMEKSNRIKALIILSNFVPF